MIDVLEDYHLPVVQLGTELRYLEGFQELGWEGFRVRETARMRDENEVMDNNLYWLGRLDSPHEWHHEIAEVTRFMTYGILACQAELDQVDEVGVSAGRLPVVSEQTIDLLSPSDISETEWQLRWTTAFNRIEMRNIRLANFVGGFLRRSGANHPDDKVIARNAMTYTHAFLDLQSIRDHEPNSDQKERSDG